MDLLSLIKNKFSHLTGKPANIYNLTGSSTALLLGLEQTPFIAFERDEEKAATLSRDIAFYRRLLAATGRVIFFPDPNGPSVAGLRAEIIFKTDESDSLVTSTANVSGNIWDCRSLAENKVIFKKGVSFDRDRFAEILIGLGYSPVSMVVEKGEFSLRGWIADVYASTADNPLRIEFFGDEMEKISWFDVETQMSTEPVNEFLVISAADPPGTNRLSEVIKGRRHYSLVSEDDVELDDDTIFLSRYSYDYGGFPAPGERNDNFRSLPVIDAGMLSLKGLGILPEERRGLEELALAIESAGRENRVMIIASSDGQAERLRDIFRDHDMIVPSVDINELLDFAGTVSITTGELSSGFRTEGMLVLTETELFGKRHAFRPIRKSRIQKLLLSIDDMTPGDFVVHREHGIGRFSGVVKQKLESAEMELILIEYEGGRLYIPIDQIGIISKYRAQEGIFPRIDRLGGKTWQRKKDRVRKKVHELASQLLALYAERKIAKGFPFSADTELHREFDSFFPYEETPDQVKAIEDIKRDMESKHPMDRLLCGDVGYGKTEVAMRAAFKAVYDNRQVAVLVPTTILAEQHYRTFRERFSGFPITIDYLSRFKTRKQINATLKGITEGLLDIVIGTHGLLSRKVLFNRLGLLIVDEEHRFGVRQKERVKEMSREIDVLNLTATPIPRTLHMAISGIRDISVIETPPEERLSVKTDVSVFDEDLLRESINKELHRDGQVFFVHNRIHTIQGMAQKIKTLAPSAEVGIAHGQLPEKELEMVMHHFFEEKIDVLVSTSIVGSGLDNPKANTIIINRADTMGLADLYQLRGRVGRSNIRAYALLLVPTGGLMTEDAKKRLQALQELSYLGAGFRLALKDLEIRGAGNIFGSEQSGHIYEIGFDLYIEMLERAVSELKGAEVKEEIDPIIDVKVSAYIPEDYIDALTLRISFYRKIASMKADHEIDLCRMELNDRFGRLPAEVSTLLDIMKLKVLARRLSIAKIRELQEKVTILFNIDTPVQPQDIFDLQKTRKGSVKFLPEGFELHMHSNREKLSYLYDVLGELAGTRGLEMNEIPDGTGHSRLRRNDSVL